jgi:hypothetical protein
VSHFCDHFISGVAAKFPNLTHLRLWGANTFVVRYLEAAYHVDFDQRLGRQSYGSDGARVPLDLQTILLDSPQEPEVGYCGTPYLYYEGLMRELRLLESSIEAITLVDGRYRQVSYYTYAEARAQWLERRRGEDGFWSAIPVSFAVKSQDEFGSSNEPPSNHTARDMFQ